MTSSLHLLLGPLQHYPTQLPLLPPEQEADVQSDEDEVEGHEGKSKAVPKDLAEMEVRRLAYILRLLMAKCYSVGSIQSVGVGGRLDGTQLSYSLWPPGVRTSVHIKPCVWRQECT